MQKITPFLWFDSQAEEAMKFYTGIFDDSGIVNISRYPDRELEGPMQGMQGKVITGEFELAGQRFLALDGGPHFRFTPAISFFVNCETAEEVDRIWRQLSDGGSVVMPLQQYPFSEKYGWLSDKYGVSWQLNVGTRAQKITPFLMFVGEQHGQAEAAIRTYTSIFSNAHIENILHHGAESGQEGAVMHAVFQLAGQDFMAMDSNLEHQFTFTPATSFYVECESQDEVDYFWEKLSAVPEAEQCGWLADQYGISWQIVPTVLPELLNDPDPEKSRRAMDAMLQMKKIDIAALQAAHAGLRNHVGP
jgi:predicted 3-demethylubiquinone-9 3-methyltransferase (glyoxalase superfamily)